MTTIDRRSTAPGGAEYDGDADDLEAGSYNLAAQVFGRPPRVVAKSKARAVAATSETYNLAARVYREPRSRAVVEAGDAAAIAFGRALLAPAAALPAVASPLAPTASKSGGSGGGLFGALSGLKTLDSLRYSGPFRWYFVSMLGVFGAMNMQMLVRGYIVFQLTGSYVALGTISMANAVPGLVLSLPGGVVADRIPKKLVQQIGNLLNALNALSIAFLMLAGMLTYQHLIINAVLQGIIQGLMMPARQSMIPDIVLPKYVMNAVALNNVGMNISRMFMPALGGFILAWTHQEGGGVSASSSLVFFIMAGFYLFSVFTLMPLSSKPIEVPESERIAMPVRAGRMGGGHGAPRTAGSGTGVKDLWDGLTYMVRDRTVGMILLVNFLMVLCSMPYMQMLPGFVSDVLKGDAGMQGALMSATAVGSLAAALVIASLPNRNRGQILIWGGALLGLALVAFCISTSFWLTMGIMVFIGVGQSTRMALSNVLVQAYTDDQYRGRVMSIYMMEMSLVQISTFFVGLLAAAVGIQWALGFTSGALVLLALGTYLFSPTFRRLA